jgi:hypothetical protein
MEDLRHPARFAPMKTAVTELVQMNIRVPTLKRG